MLSARRAVFMSRPMLARLHVLTDDRLADGGGAPHAEQAQWAASGGAGAVQFRAKGGPDADAFAALVATREVLPPGVQLVVDDRIDWALAAGADGVHLGQTDLPVAHARRLADAVRAGVLIGATVTTAEQARRAEGEGADSLGFGPVFPTTSKDNPASVKGLDGLAEACAAVQVPVLAIAGITPERVGPCLDAGAWGVAVMSAVTRAADPVAATRAFRDAISRALR